jgi:ribulose-phosphate 3-epimerase
LLPKPFGSSDQDERFLNFDSDIKSHNRCYLWDMDHLVAPSILAADFANLEHEVKMLNGSRADWIHVDVMDGVFVPNISFGIPVVKAIKKHAQKPLDVHLMIVKPENFVQEFRDAGADSITVHFEACPNLHSNIQQIKAMGCKAGVAVNPHTSIAGLKDIIQDVDLILVMSVNPGFGGQKFIENTYSKIRELKTLIKDRNAHALIEVDGGINEQNAGALLEAGATMLVAGNFVFSSPDPTGIILRLKNMVGGKASQK